MENEQITNQTVPADADQPQNNTVCDAPNDSLCDTPVTVLTTDDGQVLEFSHEQIIELAKKGLKYDSLKARLDEQEQQRAERERELSEFRGLFPYADPQKAQTSAVVQNYMQQGYSLAVAYALELAEQAQTKNIDNGNSKRSTGSAGAAPERELSFSDEQIASMSINEIKEKWPLIMTALKRKVDF